ncbi:MAG: hypothetical protein IJH40_07135 [Ruminococcus sp.]|uniref:hypothetical protein n=1 Tax=Ruminococcus sp. TaxID=41978 RepID=UPI0028738EAE|nr:hypothetical protein [Ruminococcus sp.]MBQ3285399.1 hypothetical protein [Ruminococcus sp.]
MTLKEYCKNNNPSKVTLELIEKLKAFSNEDDYFFGVLSQSAVDSDRQLIIDYIDKGKDVSYSNILLFALEVGQKREEIERQSA